MNINDAVIKPFHKKSIKDIASSPTMALNGIADVREGTLEKLGVKTVRGLGRWKFYKMAKAISGLSKMEVNEGRAEGSALNLNKALMKEHEGKPLSEIVKLPPSALQGLPEWADDGLAHVYVKTIADLGNWKFCRWAGWITDIADFEEEKEEA